MRIIIATIVLGLGATLAARGEAQQPVPAPGYVDAIVAGGLVQPTAIAFLPDGRLLITQKDGVLKLFDGTGAPETLIALSVCSGSEMGLLGVAVDPGFNANGFVYLYRTEGVGGCADPSTRRNQIVRLKMTGTPRDTIDPGSLQVILGGIRTDRGNHNAGTLRFGPDGMLYASTGDTGRGDNDGCPGESTNPYAQDLGALEGKILRIRRGGGVPKDNPFVGVAGARGEIFARGFRNPFRFSFDPDGGRLWAGDVGQGTFEEIDVVVAGGNYGWPRCEGPAPAGCSEPGDTPPVFAYPHGGFTPCPDEVGTPLGRSVTGGAFAGEAFGAQEGQYVFGDFVSRQIFRAPLTPARTAFSGAPVTIVTAAGGPVDFVRGPDGAIYYVAIILGQVRRLAAVDSPSRQRRAGRLLRLKIGPKLAEMVSDDPAITLGAADESLDDPVQRGGSVRIRTANGCQGPCDTTYPLPGGWNYIGEPGEGLGYTYQSVTGPIRSVTIEPGRIEFLGEGPQLGHRLPQDPGPVDVVVRIGGLRYCLRFGGTTEFTKFVRFRAVDAPAPGACPGG